MRGSPRETQTRRRPTGQAAAAKAAPGTPGLDEEIASLTSEVAQPRLAVRADAPIILPYRRGPIEASLRAAATNEGRSAAIQAYHDRTFAQGSSRESQLSPPGSSSIAPGLGRQCQLSRSHLKR